MANDQKPVISVRKLRKVYMMGQEHVVALHNIDLDIPRGEVCCIFGTSGSGKSTLLNQLAGLQKGTEFKAPDALDYTVGDRVRHIKYGEGTVLNIAREPRDYKVTVEFDQAGQKIMYASFAKLKQV